MMGEVRGSSPLPCSGRQRIMLGNDKAHRQAERRPRAATGYARPVPRRGNQMTPMYPKDLRPGDQIPSLEYGSLTIESVHSWDKRYPLEQLVETDRGRRSLNAEKIIWVKREDV